MYNPGFRLSNKAPHPLHFETFPERFTTYYGFMWGSVKSGSGGIDIPIGTSISAIKLVLFASIFIVACFKICKLGDLRSGQSFFIDYGIVREI